MSALRDAVKTVKTEITASELYRYLEKMIPSSLSCEWDNDGAMVIHDKDALIRRVLLTLDVTVDALAYASENSCEAVISHHPLIFRPLASLTDDTVAARAAIYAVRHNITVLSYHTRLDALENYGVNDTLADVLGITGCEAFGPEGEEIGRIGNLQRPVSFEAFCSVVKEKLGSGTLITVDAGRTVRRVALIGGDGKDYLIPAVRAGADTFLTGRCGYNLDIDAYQYGINVIEAGHYNTEAVVLKSLQKMINEQFPNIDILYYKSDATKAI